MNQFLTGCLMSATLVTLGACTGQEKLIHLTHQGDSLTVARIETSAKYLLLPIEEKEAEAQVMLGDVPMDVRLAVGKIDYTVPFPLSGKSGDSIVIRGLAADALAWENLQVADTFDITNREIFRPVYHHTPAYGWMNDANGLVFKDGEYHLYFQYNPYGSVWGNMHWGHSVSRDLVHWQHLPVAIERDTMGHIFSGSCVVDARNDAGTGTNNIIAFYTSHRSTQPGHQRQVQCMAYSSDNGRTFTKYEGNPIITPFDGLENFRDPKVFWYAPQEKWVMIVSADKNMRFYESRNLKDWTYMSEWGEGYGPQPNQFECPDFIQLPVDGDKQRMKWVMIVNINPGFVYGGSGTMYFVGDFDGHRFTCDTKPGCVKWLDWGKDHYATVCFSNTGDRTIAVPWMSNWQYANLTPSKGQYRSANALPRELNLYTAADGQLLLSAAPVKELSSLRGKEEKIGDFNLGEKSVDHVADNGAFELQFHMQPAAKGRTGVELSNAEGEKTLIYFDAENGRVVMDRAESGIVDFGKDIEPHQLETSSSRRACVDGLLHFVNDFAHATWAPVSDLTAAHEVRIFADRSSIELFVDGGRVAMTNLVFPTKPYDRLRFFSDEKAQVKQAVLYPMNAAMTDAK
ncbi:MAG: GH32 C-terminal domain-containing protein [Bacteroidales bacterium]|nr:GH32 C-terminal domain-containing protein [Bacteroidales bacterium]